MPRNDQGDRSVKRPRVTDVVLVLLMYFVTYLDRVNVSSAAAGFSTNGRSSRPGSADKRAFFARLRTP
jgi:hypothetical protein